VGDRAVLRAGLSRGPAAADGCRAATPDRATVIARRQASPHLAWKASYHDVGARVRTRAAEGLPRSRDRGDRGDRDPLDRARTGDGRPAALRLSRPGRGDRRRPAPLAGDVVQERRGRARPRRRQGGAGRRRALERGPSRADAGRRPGDRGAGGPLRDRRGRRHDAARHGCDRRGHPARGRGQSQPRGQRRPLAVHRPDGLRLDRGGGPRSPPRSSACSAPRAPR